MPFGCPVPVDLRLGGHGPGAAHWRLRDLWQLHLYPYGARVVLGDEVVVIRPGAAGITPPGLTMDYDLPHAVIHTYAHFRAGDGPGISAPLMVDLGRDYARTEADLREAIPWVVTDPRRAAIRLWDVLARVVAAAPGSPTLDVVQRARDRIEALLPRPVDIQHLATVLGCSREHLARQFRLRLGTTIVGYVRQRRVALAVHLLESTDRPIIEIAAAVGASDLQSFNKLLRRESGLSPRGLRWSRRRSSSSSPTP